MIIKEIISILEEFAPLSLQDGYDNSGVQVGDVNRAAKGVLLCLDVTEKVLEEAIALDCNLIVAHHPLLFKPLKSLTNKSYIERCVTVACKHDLVIYAAHTNLDNASGGLSFRLAEKIGLQGTQVLSPRKEGLLKLVTFVPVVHANAVRTALSDAGAGHIGNYDSCSYSVAGEGRFRAGEGANPYHGKLGEIHLEPEIRLETILPFFKKNAVLRALLASHPYEEPAYDFYSLANAWSQVGSGVIGDLAMPEDEETFLLRLKNTFQLTTLSHSPLRGQAVKKIAICGGSGASLFPEAIAGKADVFITGEARYNDYYDVEKHILLVVIGHYESEICTKELFFDIISKKIPNFAVHFSRMNTNPVNYL